MTHLSYVKATALPLRPKNQVRQVARYQAPAMTVDSARPVGAQNLVGGGSLVPRGDWPEAFCKTELSSWFLGQSRSNSRTNARKSITRSIAWRSLGCFEECAHSSGSMSGGMAISSPSKWPSLPLLNSDHSTKAPSLPNGQGNRRRRNDHSVHTRGLT